jgi:catechol 2,3-dioxygenase-like lactoylglutathione lyase family enzyme
MSDDSEPKPDFWMRPIFTVENLQASIDYYRDKLGFELKWRSGDDAAELNRSGIELILYASGGSLRAAVPGVISAELHEHIKLDKLHNEFVRTGALVRRPPHQASWQDGHAHQLEIEDLDGNRLLFWGDLP